MENCSCYGCGINSDSLVYKSFDKFGQEIAHFPFWLIGDSGILFGTADLAHNMATGVSSIGAYVPDAMLLGSGSAIFALTSWSYLEGKKNKESNKDSESD